MDIVFMAISYCSWPILTILWGVIIKKWNPVRIIATTAIVIILEVLLLFLIVPMIAMIAMDYKYVYTLFLSIWMGIPGFFYFFSFIIFKNKSIS